MTTITGKGEDIRTKIYSFNRRNCETFCNMIVFNLPYAEQAAKANCCIRGEEMHD